MSCKSIYILDVVGDILICSLASKMLERFDIDCGLQGAIKLRVNTNPQILTRRHSNPLQLRDLPADPHFK
jgi:hypothetical protein